MNLPDSLARLGLSRALRIRRPVGRRLVTDEQRLAPLFKSMSRPALYALAGWAQDEADSRIEPLLLERLRSVTALHAGDGPPVVAVEMCANPNFEDGVFWEDDWMAVHRADGSRHELEIPHREDDRDAEQLRHLLADYSCAEHPLAGQNLTVDLVLGTFTVSQR